MMNIKVPPAVAAAALCCAIGRAEENKEVATLDNLGVVTITSAQPTSLPTQIPTTMHGTTREEIARTINATDSEDAIKYFPSLLVRKRYIGDYNHAVLSSRASGTGNSARSAVYADGVLLSNYLGNGATFAPRWMLVTPEEIERVDVMYGPFSAAYAGNSVGAIVDYVTRMPARFEAHVKSSYVSQPYDLYGTDKTFSAHQESASIGSRRGNWSWWLNLNHTDSHGQPLTFPTRLVSAGVVSAAGTPVSGAVLDRDRSNNPWYILGTATEYHTIQDHGKLKLAYDFSPTLRASYMLGVWKNKSEGRPDSFLRNAAGVPVYSGTVNIDGRSYALATGDYNLSNERLTHLMHGLSFKSNSGGRWDWEVAASRFDYQTDELRQAAVFLPAALSSGAGTITDQDGTGWDTLALKGTWRSGSGRGAHIVDFGYQQEHYRLRSLRSDIAGNWLADAAGALNTRVGGDTQLQSLYAQDSWAFATDWKAVLGLRAERWQASGGFTANATNSLGYASRTGDYLSPKLALAYQLAAGRVLKLSAGYAVRTPTVNELYGATTGVLTVVNDPNLLPEKSWTSELTLQQDFGRALLRSTIFYETVNDSLYSERTAVGNTVVTRIVNVGRIVTPGAELSLQSADVIIPGLELSASVTYADSRIRRNAGYVTTPGDTIGKYQPRVPVWRATALASYSFNDRWSATLGLRYSGTQYSTLDNSDPNGYAFQGASRFLTGDARTRYRFAGSWTAALGVENLSNYKYWNFHPYPQRSYVAELQYDL